MNSITVNADLLARLTEIVVEAASICESMLSTVECLHEKRVEVTTMGAQSRTFFCCLCARAWEEPWPAVAETSIVEGEVHVVQ